MLIFLMLICLALISSLSYRAADHVSPAQDRDSVIIETVKHIPVSRLDSTLSDTMFETWIRQFVGDSTMLRWEVNDCGEQTGIPAVDTANDLPTCVEVDGRPDSTTVF